MRGVNDRVLGSCSICGGAVTQPSIVWSTVMPEPRCSSCGARPVQASGPVIEMEPAGSGRWVRDARVRAHVSLRDMATCAGIGAVELGEMERGKRPVSDEVAMLAKTIGMKT
jgi:hypothetical protein